MNYLTVEQTGKFAFQGNPAFAVSQEVKNFLKKNEGKAHQFPVLGVRVLRKKSAPTSALAELKTEAQVNAADAKNYYRLPVLDAGVGEWPTLPKGSPDAVTEQLSVGELSGTILFDSEFKSHKISLD